MTGTRNSRGKSLPIISSFRCRIILIVSVSFFPEIILIVIKDEGYPNRDSQKERSILQLFGNRVRELRLQHGWTQEDLGEKARRHWTYIGGIERGERNITLRVVEDIARALGVKVHSLFNSSQEGEDE